jgi:hypothetical protein
MIQLNERFMLHLFDFLTEGFGSIQISSCANTAVYPIIMMFTNKITKIIFFSFVVTKHN